MSEKVIIYTDGACSGNPGPGGWGAILMYKGAKKEISGGMKETTNNIMEITAVVEALKCLKVESDVQVYSDSAYTVNAFKQGWIYNWIKVQNNKEEVNKEGERTKSQVVKNEMKTNVQENRQYDRTNNNQNYRNNNQNGYNNQNRNYQKDSQKPDL